MELILNELSFDGQFQSQDDFVEYVLDILMPVLNIVIDNKVPLLKKSDLYNCKITDGTTMQDLLMRTNDPSVSLLKNCIVNLGYCEPYWDIAARTDPEAYYQYPASADEPNCFTEAIERDDKLLSLQYSIYNEDEFLCKRNEEEVKIYNITEVKKILKDILLEDKTKVRYVIERYPYERSVTCVEVDGKCFAEEALLDSGLENRDLLHIVEAIVQLIEDLGQGRKSNVWDKLQDDIFELRLHISGNRIFRLLFVQNEGIRFLNGFIKKTQKTPALEIAKAIEIKKTYVIKTPLDKGGKTFYD